MLEILYETSTKRIVGWCSDPSQFNYFTPTQSQAVISLPITPPDFPADYYILDLVNQLILPNPDYTTPQDELDTLRAEELLSTSPQVITMPQMWELMRIFGRRLRYRF